MNADDVFRVVLVTAPDVEVGRKLACVILEARLAACVNIVPQIESHYWWEGKIQTAQEVLLVIKTKSARINLLEEAIVAEHPYETPEFVTLPISEGSGKYLKWLADSAS